MLPRNHPDRIGVSFDDHRLVANAGLLLPATLAHHLGLRELVDHHLDLAPQRIESMMNTAFPDLRGTQWTKAVPPVPHGLMADVDAALTQKIFDLSQR